MEFAAIGFFLLGLDFMNRANDWCDSSHSSRVIFFLNRASFESKLLTLSFCQRVTTRAQTLNGHYFSNQEIRFRILRTKKGRKSSKKSSFIENDLGWRC